MAKTKIGMQFKGFEELAARIDKLAGTDGLKRAVEAGLKSSKQFVNGEITKAMQPSKLPAKGQYSTGDTLKTLNKDFAVDWQGSQASVKVGFDITGNGLTSIFLMYGTPRMNPDNDLYNAVYGKATQRQIKKLQETAVNEVIKRIMGA